MRTQAVLLSVTVTCVTGIQASLPLSLSHKVAGAIRHAGISAGLRYHSILHRHDGYVGAVPEHVRRYD